jgi:hypothetical protein
MATALWRRAPGSEGSCIVRPGGPGRPTPAHSPAPGPGSMARVSFDRHEHDQGPGQGRGGGRLLPQDGRRTRLRVLPGPHTAAALTGDWLCPLPYPSPKQRTCHTHGRTRAHTRTYGHTHALVCVPATVRQVPPAHGPAPWPARHGVRVQNGHHGQTPVIHGGAVPVSH